MNVSLPADLLEAIYRVSENRSRFLAEAAREKLATLSVPPKSCARGLRGLPSASVILWLPRLAMSAQPKNVVTMSGKFAKVLSARR